MSASVGAWSESSGTRAAERDARPGSLRFGAPVDLVRGRAVLDGDPDGLEERDLLVGGAPPDPSEEELPVLAHDVAVAHEALRARDEEVAGLGERRLPPVDPEPRARHGRA